MSLDNTFPLNVTDELSLPYLHVTQGGLTTSPPTMQVPARLLEYAAGRFIALPAHVTYGLVEEPTVVGIPGAATYAYGMLAWQGARLPLLDIHTLVDGDTAVELSVAPRYALIVAYQCTAREPLVFAAIGLASLPKTIFIGDDAQCALPGTSQHWLQYSLSCFSYLGQAVPIVSLASLLTR